MSYMKQLARAWRSHAGDMYTASTRHTNKQKHIFSCGNTVTHHYTTCACRCGVAALFFFCPRHCRFGFVAALPLWCCCGIAAVFAALPLGFCCGLAALVLLGQLCSRHCLLFFAALPLARQHCNCSVFFAELPQRFCGTYR